VEAATLPSASIVSLAYDGPSEVTQSSGRDVLSKGLSQKTLNCLGNQYPYIIFPFLTFRSNQVSKEVKDNVPPCQLQPNLMLLHIPLLLPSYDSRGTLSLTDAVEPG